ncbi:hypothetical protein ARSEF4850_010086 [Beauveria asiatica]
MAARSTGKGIIYAPMCDMTAVAPQHGAHGLSGKSWSTLAQLLPSRCPDYDYWWHLTGKQLSTILEAAGYPISSQYEALLFHYFWFVPSMGPAPLDSKVPAWPTQLSLEGLPIEFSWKWNTASRGPEVRYTIEPMGQLRGTAEDPLNQDATRQLLNRLQVAFPSVNLNSANHFFATLYDADRSKYVSSSAPDELYNTTTLVAAEFKPAHIGFKTYFIPRWSGLDGSERNFKVWWDKGLRKIASNGPASAILMSFINTSQQGKLLTPV